MQIHLKFKLKSQQSVHEVRDLISSLQHWLDFSLGYCSIFAFCRFKFLLLSCLVGSCPAYLEPCDVPRGDVTGWCVGFNIVIISCQCWLLSFYHGLLFSVCFSYHHHFTIRKLSRQSWFWIKFGMRYSHHSLLVVFSAYFRKISYKHWYLKDHFVNCQR